MKILEQGKVIVIKPTVHFTVVPLFCPVCQFPMKTSDDSSAYKTYECCDLCGLTFASGNKEKWFAGWRPAEDVLKPYKAEKELLKKPLLIIR